MNATNEQLQLPLPGPRITRITIARLHNLGNYEHVRWEVTVDLPPGSSPASVGHDLEVMLEELDPQPPMSHGELAHYVRYLKKPQSSDDSAEAERRALAAERIAAYQAWEKRRRAAMARLDELGGTRVATDAKQQWGPDEA